jgi:hypothetical protein
MWVNHENVMFDLTPSVERKSSAVLLDSVSCSVVWDGGPPFDNDARPRSLAQIFAVFSFDAVTAFP